MLSAMPFRRSADLLRRSASLSYRIAHLASSAAPATLLNSQSRRILREGASLALMARRTNAPNASPHFQSPQRNTAQRPSHIR
jgi:hypothetical protein